MKKLNLHSIFLELIKKEVKASFSAIEENKGKYFVKIIKDKETSLFELAGSPQSATPETYMQVLQQIKDYYEGQI